MIDLTIYDEAALERAAQRARERHIIIPTFQQMINPHLIPQAVQEKLQTVGLWYLNPLNLFRITWHNEPKVSGGGFGGVNFVEIPPALSGFPPAFFVLLGKWFPTGAHKVGAAFGCRLHASSPANLIPPAKRRYGRLPAIIAGAALTILTCSVANLSLFCRKG